MKLVVVSVQRPIFRGDKAGAFAASCARLAPVAAAEGFELVVWPTPVTGPEEAEAVADALDDASPDLLLVQATTFATHDCFAPLLGLDCLMAVWGIPEPTTSGPLPLNSLCGTNFVLSMDDELERLPWLYGQADDPVWTRRFRAILAATRARVRLRTAKVLLIGDTAPTFDRFHIAPWLIDEHYGTQVEVCKLDKLFKRVKAVSKAKAAAAVKSLREEGADRLTDDQITAAARLDVALRSLAEGHDAIALRCWPECAEQTGAMPCASVARLFDQGCPAACEGDVLGALSMLAIGALAQSDPVLLDLSHLADDHLLFWHCGNAPKSLAANGSRLGTHFNRPELGCVREMTLAPGPTTMLRFTDPGHMAVFEGDWLPGGPDFDGVTGRLANIRWNGVHDMTPPHLLTMVLDSHMPHHFAFAGGHHATAALMLADWLGCELESG